MFKRRTLVSDVMLIAAMFILLITVAVSIRSRFRLDSLFLVRYVRSSSPDPRANVHLWDETLLEVGTMPFAGGGFFVEISHGEMGNLVKPGEKPHLLFPIGWSMRKDIGYHSNLFHNFDDANIHGAGFALNWYERNNIKHWGVALPGWIMLCGVGIFIYRLIRRRNREGRDKMIKRCVRCGYDVRANKDRCPECGMPIPNVV